MELTKERALEILRILSVRFIPSKGTAIEQAIKAVEEKGFILKDDGEIYRTLTEEDLKLNPELEKEGCDVGDEVGLGTLQPAEKAEDKKSKPGNAPAPSKGLVKVKMIENVLHDSMRYDKGEEYEVEKEIAKVFSDKKFIA